MRKLRIDLFEIKLKLESTVLTDFDLLYGTTRASTISILRSNITSMDFLYRIRAPALIHLSLSGNIIKELDFAIFRSIPNVQYLNLSFNQIVTITKAQLSNTYNLKFLERYETISLHSSKCNRRDNLDVPHFYRNDS
ncbi:hypothetical protein GJ496_004500 [Pomphorhynchus laevis]|nr:hypothetical protein GJ496_004500 [Pomphorhynchus laevis]